LNMSTTCGGWPLPWDRTTSAERMSSSADIAVEECSLGWSRRRRTGRAPSTEHRDPPRTASRARRCARPEVRTCELRVPRVHPRGTELARRVSVLTVREFVALPGRAEGGVIETADIFTARESRGLGYPVWLRREVSREWAAPPLC
jgi:hypothetical protein